MSIEDFVESPVEYFDSSFTALMSIPRKDVEALQLEGLKYRFGQMRDRIGFLKKLADKQHIDEIGSIEDVVPLLFEHTIYKSYPSSLLVNNRFDLITGWVSKLTTHDLSHVDASGCDSIDSWFDAMDEQTPLTMVHSSGTSGTVSFLPKSKNEVGRNCIEYRLFFQNFGDPRPNDIQPDVDIIVPSYRRGGSWHFRAVEGYLKGVAKGDESRLHCAFDTRMSADILYLAGRIRAAKQKGELDRLEIPPGLLNRLREYESKQQSTAQKLQEFLEYTTNKLEGKRVWLMGAFTYLYPMAEQGLAKGRRGVFQSNSVVASGGGSKGVTPPPNWQGKLAEFTGVSSIKMSYGMSEVNGLPRLCEHGKYHLMPWAIPFILDPDTSKPLPRHGTVTGRMAYFDLIPESRWGGFITGDEVTMHWDEPCRCGQTSVYLDGDIARYSERRGGDDKISCAASADAHDEAMDFLGQMETAGAA